MCKREWNAEGKKTRAPPRRRRRSRVVFYNGNSSGSDGERETHPTHSKEAGNAEGKGKGRAGIGMRGHRTRGNFHDVACSQLPDHHLRTLLSSCSQISTARSSDNELSG